MLSSPFCYLHLQKKSMKALHWKLIPGALLLGLFLSNCSGLSKQEASASGCETIALDSLLVEDYLQTLRSECDAPWVECLISLIDMDATGRVFPIDSLRSSLYQYEINNYLGIRSAVALEYLFSPEKIMGFDKMIYPKILPSSRAGVDDPFEANQSLSRQEMMEMKRLYANWWSQHKSVPVDSIRKTYDSRAFLEGKFYWVKFSPDENPEAP